MKKETIDRGIYAAAAVTSVLYIFWRIFFTIPFSYGTAALIGGIFLAAAEAVGMLEGLERCFGMIKKYTPKRPELSPEKYPHVDVLISTYNESEELLYKTINGCLNMEYPHKEKVHIYLCDDGDREGMAALAEKMGIGYFRRDEHTDAKAGNLNHALELTHSPLIATFDADMIPLHDFLMATVPYFFLPNEKIGFIQTPQSFYNADLFQYNLYSEGRLPNEQDYFFRDINVGRNHTNTPIYAGSNTVISREALEDAGGFYTGVITEDFATGIMIQNEGYACYAIDEIHAIGLAPSDLKGLIKQRERWGRGCIQTFRRLHIFRMKKLSIWQKLSYTACLLYWYTYFRRFIYILAPVLFGVFGIRVVSCSVLELFLFWFPSYYFYYKTLNRLSGNIRTTRWSNVYDTILMPPLLLPLLIETLGIRKKEFSVTKKEKQKENRFFRYGQILPHCALILLSVIGIYRCIWFTLEQQGFDYSVVLFWLGANLYSLLMSVFFLLSRPVYRNAERFFAEIPIRIISGDGVWETKTVDLSETGLSFSMEFPEYLPPGIVFPAVLTRGKSKAELQMLPVRTDWVKGKWIYGVKIAAMEEENKRKYLQMVFDREPALPKVIQPELSVFDDIYTNIHKRLRTDSSSGSSLPLIILDAEVWTKECGIVRLWDFNYEYLSVKGSVLTPLKEHLSVDLGEGVSIRCIFCKEKARGEYRLYRIQNIKEFVTTRAFRYFLAGRIEDYNKKCREMAGQAMVRTDHVLNEMQLLREMEQLQESHFF